VFTHGFVRRRGAVGAVHLLFLHAGFLHLFGNISFVDYGTTFEHRLGALPYLIAYLGTGVAATLFHPIPIKAAMKAAWAAIRASCDCR